VTRPRIQLLPEHLIDQIKAGEVVERPANVLKELVENALDAGARRIEVEIGDNGLALLRVSDDGQGIAPDQLETAFGRHATSKISRFEDLYRLHTFGFRGEALPSIASVSRLECASWAEGLGGATIRFDGGLPQGQFPAGPQGRAHGTVMTVRELFYNTPVRLKFLQSGPSERNWLKRFFYAYALAHPDKNFTIQWDDGEKLLYPAAGDGGHAARVRQLYGSKASLQIREARGEWQDLRCHVVAVDEGTHRADGPLEHVLVNQRPLLDKTFTRIMQQLWEKHTSSPMPRVLLMLDLPGEQVDVNVHPNKTVVKFHQHHEVLALVTATWRKLLPAADASTAQASAPQLFGALGAHDLARDRGESYTQHMWALAGGAASQGSNAGTASASPGPYFLWRGEWYVDGRGLLARWANCQMATPAEALPLLVSHPLRSYPPDANQRAHLQSAGFELDELEPGLWVLRAIPDWGQGVPVEILTRLALGAPLDVFPFETLSPGKWDEVWDATPPDKTFAVALTPALFR